MIISCPSCETRVELDSSAWTRCAACRTMVFPRNGGPEVVVAHESERIAACLGVVVSDAGMQPLHAPDGAAALRLIEVKRPPAAVLDVGLPEVMSFQIIDRVRARPELACTKVILVASVFKRTAYKRRPTSLYGADDYVEQHHVHDLLPVKLCSLLQRPAPAGEDWQRRIGAADTREDLTDGQRVSALARSIAADIALYHPEEMARAVSGQSAPTLERAIDEGRRLLVEMVGAPPAGPGDPVSDALRTLIGELRRGGRA